MPATRTRSGSSGNCRRAQAAELGVMSNFQKYSAYYDLLYRDKDYEGEAQYVADTLRAVSPGIRKVLEFGAGTGKHGRLLAGKGFEVRGIERSAEMAALANSMAVPGPGSFTCRVGDIIDVSPGEKFDAVIALFHVISYLTDNAALLKVFRTASDCLDSGGTFFFDVWHGPAVLTERPTERTKAVADDRYSVRRTARPCLDTNAGTVKVVYEMECEDALSKTTDRFGEEHLMHYLFPTEVDLLARSAGFQIVKTEEFLTAAPVSSSTWGVAYVLRKS